MSTRMYKARHKRPSKTAPTIAATTMSSAFVLGSIASASPAGAASADDFRRLRQCESGGNYRANTGNHYYGAYQFALGTWRGLGYSGYPHKASPATQDAAARRLQAMSGWRPWPGCARKLGLYGGGGQATRATRSVPRHRTYRSAPTIHRLAKGTVLKPPAAPKRAFKLQVDGTPRTDVRRWQLQMARRGWRIDVDGYFGPQSLRVMRKFVHEKHLHRTAGHSMTEVVWNATWQSPVT
jgi:resuscitation-promoting factor RpfA